MLRKNCEFNVNGICYLCGTLFTKCNGCGDNEIDLWDNTKTEVKDNELQENSKRLL